MEKKKYVINNILNSKLILKPFPHLIIDNLLPIDFFIELKNYIRKINDVERFTIHSGRWCFKTEKWKSILEDLKGILYNDEIRKILNNKFKSQLEKKKEYMSESKWDINLTFDLENYQIPPHMDSPSKQLSVLFYITGGSNGTSLYDNNNDLDYKKAKKVKEVEFKENRLFVFCPSIFDRTWHGVDNINKQVKRITIQSNLTLIKKPKITWHSFGIGSIRYKYKKRTDKFY